MTNAYSIEGLVAICLLVICTCAYMSRVPKLKQWFFNQKSGFWGVLYKSSVKGIRLHIAVAIACLTMSVYLIV